MAAARSLVLGAVTTQAADGLDRTVLPIQFPKPAAITEVFAKDVKGVPHRQEVKAPDGEPNVIVVLIDDLGFGARQVFGRPRQTPTMERVAKGRLRDASFHTTALCSPTRVALQSGRNHQTGNMGFITAMAPGVRYHVEAASAVQGQTGQRLAEDMAQGEGLTYTSRPVSGPRFYRVVVQ